MHTLDVMRLLAFALLLSWGFPALGQTAPLLTEHARLTSTVPSQFGEGLGISVAVLDGPDGAVLEASRVYAGAYQHDGEYQYQGGVYAFWPGASGGWIVADTLVAWNDRNRNQDTVGLRATTALRLDDGTDLVVANSDNLHDPTQWNVLAGGAEVFRLWPRDHPDGDPDRLKWTFEGSVQYPRDPLTGRQPLRNGWDVALTRDLANPGEVFLYTGATSDRDTTGNKGQVCIFRRSATGAWSPVRTITFESTRLSTSGFIGRFIAAAASARIPGGQVVLAGAHDARVPSHTGPGHGSAYVLERQLDGNWREAARFLPDDTSVSDGFGWGVEIVDAPEGLFAFVGHASEAPANGLPRGAVYVYRRNGETGEGLGIWEREATLRAAGPTGRYGWNLSAAARTGGGILLGVTAQSASIPEHPGILQGAAYVYYRDPSAGAWTTVARLIPSDAAGSGYYGNDIAVTPGGLAVVGRAGRVPWNVNGTAYLYDLRGLLPVSTLAPAPQRPRGVSIESVRPQPAGRYATVAVRLAEPGAARVQVVDALGRVVLRAEDAERPAGTHEIPLDISGLAPGVYAVRIQVRAERASARLVVAR